MEALHDPRFSPGFSDEYGRCVFLLGYLEATTSIAIDNLPATGYERRDVHRGLGRLRPVEFAAGVFRATIRTDI